MRITIDKTMVGNVVYGIPTGNNATRGVKRQVPVKFFVKAMARKYATLQRIYGEAGENTGIEEKHDPYCGNGFNAGYVFFKSLDDVNAWYSHAELSDKAWKLLSTPSGFARLSDKTLNLIINELETKEK